MGRTTWDVIELLVKVNLVSSKSEGRRMVEQGGVRINGDKVESIMEVEVKTGDIVQVGKRKFIKIK